MITIPIKPLNQCEFTKSSRASLILTCQPFPWDLKKSTTAASNRMVIDSFVGAFCAPLVRLYAFTTLGIISFAGFSLASSSSVSSYVSGSAAIPLAIFSSVMASIFAQTDYSYDLTPHGENQYHAVPDSLLIKISGKKTKNRVKNYNSEPSKNYF